MFDSKSFWVNKKVFITGHTGFKGSWLTLWLKMLGAEVVGYSLAPKDNQNLFDLVKIGERIDKSIINDIRNFEALKEKITSFNPEIIFHLAAQPLVLYSYQNPIETYSTNVMGTVNLLEACRSAPSAKSVVVVTSDKCYENKEWEWGYRENEPMGGVDPYSNSKGCAELVTSAYRESFFKQKSSDSITGLATARAGNVIGGGDWSENRLIPDAIKAISNSRKLIVRNPNAIRPWQHVLEPLSGYILLAESLFNNAEAFSSGWNFGPGNSDARSVKEILDIFFNKYGVVNGWECNTTSKLLHEATSLKLDCSKANKYLHWAPIWDAEQAIEKVVEWHMAHENGHDMQSFTMSQISNYQTRLLSKNT